MPHPLYQLRPLLDEARHQAVRDRAPVLVSVADRVPLVDALDALERVLLAAADDAGLRGVLGEGAAYWARPAERFALAGAGSTVVLTASGPGRFREVDAARELLEQRTLADDPSGGKPGVGPVLMGGFAFDPDGPRTAAWSGFPNALLAVPRLQVAVLDGQCWITTNVRVDASGAPDADARVLARLRDVALDPDAPSPRPVGGHADLHVAERPTGAEWRALVREATAEIAAGAMEKVVLARSLQVRGAAPFDPFVALRHLREGFPSTHVFGVWRGERAFIGATPERLVQLEGDVVRSSSLAGSIRRGATADEDRALRESLLASAKDRSEHELVRRALRDALAAVCEDVSAPETPAILTLPQVHHLHTPVTARLRQGRTLLEVIERVHPTPAVGGAPREAALDFLREREPLDRGWYAAPVGWLGRGRGEFAVALRSAVVAGREATLFAGCGIVAASDAADEYEESALKLRPMQAALAAAGAAPASRPRPVRSAAASGGAR